MVVGPIFCFPSSSQHSETSLYPLTTQGPFITLISCRKGVLTHSQQSPFIISQIWTPASVYFTWGPFTLHTCYHGLGGRPPLYSIYPVPPGAFFDIPFGDISEDFKYILKDSMCVTSKRRKFPYRVWKPTRVLSPERPGSQAGRAP